MPSEDKEKVLALSGEINLKYCAKKVSAIKEKIEDKLNSLKKGKRNEEKSLTEEDIHNVKEMRIDMEELKQMKESKKEEINIAEKYVIQNTAELYYYTHILVRDCCPFMCKLEELDGRHFKHVNKRKLLQPFKVLYVANEFMMWHESHQKFKVFNECYVNLKQTRISLSYQVDFYLFF